MPIERNGTCADPDPGAVPPEEEADLPAKNVIKRQDEEAKRSGGFTLIELVAAGAILAIGACGLSSVLVNAMTTTAVNRESSQARAAAQQLLEQIQNIPVGDVFATFNDDTRDDPLGPSTAPGSSFEIELKPAAAQVSSMTGEVLFPTLTSMGALREDVRDEQLGMPRDLNGDGEIDSLSHSRDYVVLPVRIRVVWRGATGQRSLEMCSLLMGD